MRHVIKTQVIDLATDKQSEAFGLQHRMSEVFYQFILPVLEKTFDELSPGEELIQIDRLELNLGFIPAEAFDRQQFPLQVLNHLYKQLKEILQLLQAKKSPQPVQLGIARQWLYYMQHGYLPWNGSKISSSWYSQVLKAFATDHASIQLLRALIRNNDKALKRIVRLHDTVFLTHLLETISAKSQQTLSDILDAIIEAIYSATSTGNTSVEAIQMKRKLWQAVILHATTHENVSQQELIVLAAIPQLIVQEINMLLEHCSVKKPLQEIESPLRQRRKELNGFSSVEIPIVKEKQVLTIPAKYSLPEEGVFIANAGLVIIHPFIEHFFKTLGLLNNNLFEDENCRQKALSLLQYLVTGFENGDEHNWVMAKILCGVPLEEPIETEFSLTNEEKREADDLLLEVIGRWAILKNSSVAALRETFLQRPGKLLTDRNGEMRLQVELNPLDMLLQYLPWSISIIRFVWMPQVLKVDWK